MLPDESAPRYYGMVELRPKIERSDCFGAQVSGPYHRTLQHMFDGTGIPSLRSVPDPPVVCPQV